MSSINIESGFSLPPEASKWYNQSPRKYYKGEYLGRDLAIVEVDNPVPHFLIGSAAFFISREFSRFTNSPIGEIIAFALLASTPLFTKRFIYDRQPERLMNNFLR